MKFIRELILEGKIPHFRTIKTIALVFSFLPIPVYFLAKLPPKDFGDLGWNLLIGIMLIRPLADVLPGLGILRSLVLFRKEFGIAAAWLILLHCYGAFSNAGTNLFSAIFQAKYWQLSHPFMWGIIGILATALLLITSNNFSLKLLRNNWKRLQRLSYLLFFTTAVHIALLKNEVALKAVIPAVAVIIFWLLAHFKIKWGIFTEKPSEQTPQV